MTVQGQVYVPSNYRVSVGSGYIQDSSGRGINLFGDAANVAPLWDVGNVVEVTGEVALFFTTVEIVDISSVVLVSGGNPELLPQHLTTGQANNSAWEGTFIEVTGAIVSTMLSGPGRNYYVNDGTGQVNVRVVNTLGIPEPPLGTIITARGAGATFQADYQILVGRQNAFYPDTPVAVEPRTWCAVKAMYRP